MKITKIVLILIGLAVVLPIIMLFLYKGLINLTVNRTATDVASCRTIEYGYKACGGAVSHLIYSVETTNEDRLQKFVEGYNNSSRRLQSFSLLMSTCDITPEPKLILENSQCVGVSADIRILPRIIIPSE